MVPTRRTFLLIGVAVALGSMGISRPVAAQAIYPGVQRQASPRYQPRLSPYLDLLRNDNSALSPYHSFVVPRRQLYQQQLRQSVEINRLQKAASQHHSILGGMGGRLPTGRGGQFQTYLHFYRRDNRP